MDDTVRDPINPAVRHPTSCPIPPKYDNISLADDEPSDKPDIPEAEKDPGSDSVNGKTAPQQTYERKTKYEVGWRRIVRNFTPSWFAVTMGTGVCGVLLHSLPWQARWLDYLSIIFFVLNAALFGIFTIMSVLRYTIWPEIWAVMIQDPVHSLFLGTVPMGFATLIQLWVAVCVPSWGLWAGTFAWVLWMVDTVVAAAIAISLPFLVYSTSFPVLSKPSIN